MKYKARDGIDFVQKEQFFMDFVLSFQNADEISMKNFRRRLLRKSNKSEQSFSNIKKNTVFIFHWPVIAETVEN